ncbi:dual specificity protein phosphatase 19-like isoform X2 [Varroa jacobsoni]|uniref:dual specificity protein phosphatase 19-like isoform X2 n=1 Tax=Varroa jacobsoni TaxID=62625 RepID=UPI000BFA4900|nr:dual specificity protein phosphatase 19-like isoform X2 [Varroa jacobsoni]
MINYKPCETKIRSRPLRIFWQIDGSRITVANRLFALRQSARTWLYWTSAVRIHATRRRERVMHSKKQGNVLLERRNSAGGFSGILNPEPRTQERCRGFVYDFKPDLQMASITPGLYLSSQDVASNLELLRSRNIRHIINVAWGIPNYFPQHFRYLKLRLLDLPEQNVRLVFEECFDFIDEAMSTGGSTLVHCNAGVSRSSTICIAYLMNRQRMRLVPALNQVRMERPIIRPNDGFMQQLKEYEKEIHPLTT